LAVYKAPTARFPPTLTQIPEKGELQFKVALTASQTHFCVLRPVFSRWPLVFPQNYPIIVVEPPSNYANWVCPLIRD